MKYRVGSKGTARARHQADAPRIETLEGRRLLSGTAADSPAPFASLEAAAEVEATQRPSVSSTNPAAGATEVDPSTFVRAYVTLPNVGGVTDDPAVLAANVKLFRAGDVTRTPISAKVNTTGGGDAIILTPLAPLAGKTEYQFEVSEGLTDTAGAPFQPFSMRFTTGEAVDAGPDPNVAFTKVSLPTAAGSRFTGLTIGPDNRLYAGTMDGDVIRFDIQGDGTLGTATVIRTIRNNNGGARRIVTGLRFDPAATAAAPVLWVTHGDGAEIDAPDWTGKLTRLSGASLGEYQDYVTGLPRSVRDHLTQQMDFKPGTNLLYVSQGSSNSMGAPDNAWGLRDERLLSAAVLQVDTAAIAQRVAAGGGALDVRTEGVDEAYDPFAAGAPVTLYATGVRNAYDLVWHSNGALYAPTNGAAPGGNTPAGGGATALKSVPQNQPDLLFNIHEGKYYGHPNPLRDEFVLNGGNPTDAKDPFEVPAYKVGTRPDPNWEQAVFNFGDNRSPNGVIEYKSNAFNNTLKGALIVAEYSGGDDLVVLRPDAAGNIPANGVSRGMVGTTGFVDPVDLVEHVGPGNLYVVEYGARRITLLKPQAVEVEAPRNAGRAIFNDVRGGSPSPARKLMIRNPYPASITVDSISITGDGAGMFRITAAPATPVVLAAGASVEVSVVFDPPSGTPLGIETAGLRVHAVEDVSPLELSLRGLVTAGEGGALEPSLQRIMDVNELPIEVGDADPDTGEMPLPLNAPNDAVEIEALVKAGTGPVRVEVLSVFASAGTPTILFGHYNPINGVQTSVLSVTESQRTRPPLSSGGMSFDPGSGVFGLYTLAGAFGTTAYTEPEKNTFEPVVDARRKALFYPLVDVNGEPVADAFVVAFEEVAGTYDYQDFVAIIRNVRAADVPPPAPELTVLFDDRDLAGGATVDFGRVNEGEAEPERTVTIRNDGNRDLTIGAVTLPAGYELVRGLTTTTLTPGQSDTIRIALSTAAPGTLDAQATIASDDADEGTFGLRLTGVVADLPDAPTPTPTPPPPPAEQPVITAGVTGGFPSVVIPGTKTAKGKLAVVLTNNHYTSFNGPVTISVMAGNGTGAASGTGAANVSASATGDAAAALETELARVIKTLKLKPFATKRLNLSVAVPPSVPEGDKTLSVAVLNGSQVAVAPGSTFRVEAATVRLRGAPDQAPAGALRFGRAGIKVPLRNDGNVATTRTPVTYELTVAATTDPTGAAPVYQTTAVGKVSLKPGQARSQSLKVNLPPGAFPPGNYFLFIRLQAELNDSNGQTLVTMPFSIA